MRVVVTGGAGFLGSHLCEALCARGDAVVCVDDYSTGSAQNVAALVGNPSFELVVADVSRSLPVAGAVDAVCHLASPASPPAYLARPLETLAVGSEGTRLALELAEAHAARFVLASTSEIYGDPEEHPQTKSYWGHVNPTGPRSVYDEAKRFAEALTFAHRRAKGTDTAVVRIFNTYGPRLSPGDGRVVSNFCVQALSATPLTVYGSGTQTRSLCYVDDLVRGLLLVLDSDTAGPVNLGNPEEITVGELAALVLELSGSSSALVYEPLPEDDPTRRCPDITVARSVLHWQPEVDLRAGICLTLAHFEALLAQGAPAAGGTR